MRGGGEVGSSGQPSTPLLYIVFKACMLSGGEQSGRGWQTTKQREVL